MTYNVEALPVAIPLLAVGLGLIVFKVPLMRFSDLLWGLDRSSEQRRDLARMAYIPAVLLIGWALAITFLPVLSI
jgi:hypothetical protein